MGFFGKAKIEGAELQKCLTYYEAEDMVIAFQTKEADLYNNTLVQYLNSIETNPLAAEEVRKAANRLNESANEIIRRHEEIQPIPDAASAMRYAWYVTFLANKTWSEATRSAMEAVANGMTPHYVYVQQTVNEYQSAWGRAHEEDKKFLKQLKVSADDIARIVARTNSAVSVDKWAPPA